MSNNRKYIKLKWKILSAGADADQQVLSYTAGGKTERYIHFGKQVAISYKVKHVIML